MTDRRGSRVLNDNTLFFGLDFNDVIALGVVLIISQSVLKIFEKQNLAILVPFVTMLILIPIRLHHRRRIIRDYLHSKLSPRKIHAPGHYRN